MFFVVCNLRTREFQTEEEAAAVTEELKELIYHSEKKANNTALVAEKSCS